MYHPVGASSVSPQLMIVLSSLGFVLDCKSFVRSLACCFSRVASIGRKQVKAVGVLIRPDSSRYMSLRRS